MLDNTGKIQGDTKFKKGQSGNPKGRPYGSKNKSTLAAESLLEGSLEGICRRIEEAALEGNMQAAKMILDRFLPVRKERLIEIKLNKITTQEDVLKSLRSIISAVSEGKITPSEADSLSKTIEMYSKALENCEIEKRLKRLEDSLE